MHLLYIMQFDRLLAALVLIKYEALICGIFISNHQKSCFCIRYICLSSAFSIWNDKHIHILLLQVSV